MHRINQPRDAVFGEGLWSASCSVQDSDESQRLALRAAMAISVQDKFNLALH